eukprot:1149335-Prymnesium_polylepis.1
MHAASCSSVSTRAAGRTRSADRSPRGGSLSVEESHVGSPLNDWADAMADAARGHDIVGAFSMPPSHFSATLAAPRGGVLRCG